MPLGPSTASMARTASCRRSATRCGVPNTPTTSARRFSEPGGRTLTSIRPSAPSIVRALEIPTPSWLAYDKVFYGDKFKLPDDTVLVQQERAYTSPVWLCLS